MGLCQYTNSRPFEKLKCSDLLCYVCTCVRPFLRLSDRVSGRSSVYLSVCPSLRLEQLSSHWKDLHMKFNISILLSKYVSKIQESLFSDYITVLYVKTNILFDNICS